VYSPSKVAVKVLRLQQAKEIKSLILSLNFALSNGNAPQLD
jgi:hypothetical protein